MSSYPLRLWILVIQAWTVTDKHTDGVHCNAPGARPVGGPLNNLCSLVVQDEVKLSVGTGCELAVRVGVKSTPPGSVGESAATSQPPV